jgi:sulfite reductase beta subunit-like hemoprotein
MRRLIAEGKANSSNGAALNIIAESEARGEKPAENAHRRLAKKFLAKYESQRREGETWGDFCRRIEGELQPK